MVLGKSWGTIWEHGGTRWKHLAIPHTVPKSFSHHPHAIHVVTSMFGMDDPSFPNVVPIRSQGLCPLFSLLFLDMCPSSPAIP